MKNLKFLPHLSVLALISFLIADISSFYSEKPSISLIEPKHSQGSHHEGEHKKSRNIEAISPEEKEKRMGIFHYNGGNKSFKEGNFEEAIINYKKALHHNKSFKEAIINLATAYMKNSDFDSALKTLQKGMVLDSENPHIYYNYACYYSLTGKPEASLEKLKQAIDFGFDKFKQIETDPDLENLRQSTLFKGWAQALKI